MRKNITILNLVCNKKEILGTPLLLLINIFKNAQNRSNESFQIIFLALEH